MVTAAAVDGPALYAAASACRRDDQAFIVDDAEALALIVEGRRSPSAAAPSSAGRRGSGIFSRSSRSRAAATLLAEMKWRARAAWDEADAEFDLLARLYRRHHRALEGRDDRAPMRLNMSAIIFSDWEWPEDIRYLASTPSPTRAGSTSSRP